jgi:uncharacterized protein (TIGR02145 family)
MKTKLLKKIVVQTRFIASLPFRLIASQRAKKFSPLPAICIMLCAPVVLPAQNGVTVSNLAVNAGTVTFNVAWDKNAANMPSVWLDSAWVFVDYNVAGTMKRLPLLPGATLTATSAPGIGKVAEISGNNKGVWVVGNAKTASSGSFSATVQLLTSVNDIGGACAYASNYPPVGEYMSATKISFTGTPMYEIALAYSGGGHDTVTSGNTFLLPPASTVTSFTDATGAPGIMKCMPPATYTLKASALAFCAGLINVQFALSGTEDGRSYQLYRNNSAVGVVLNGTGNAATFTGSFNVAGAYTAQTVADELYCATAMNGTRVVIENPLPANPTVFGASRHCPGTVTLGASSNGALIDWYADAAGTTTLHTGASYTTPKIETSTTYYVQARVENTGCLSARVPVSAEVITEGCCHAPGATTTFAAFNPCATVATGATWTLTDSRDNKTYTVRLMEDSHVWMVQDLEFGDCTENSWTFDNSESATRQEPTVATGYVGHCRTSPSIGGGYLYNWAAVMNNSHAIPGQSNYDFDCSGTDAASQACQGICPDGWHVPTGGSGSEWSALLSYFPNIKCSSNPNASGLSPICSGLWYPNDNGSWRTAPATSIYWWSSTYYGVTSYGYDVRSVCGDGSKLSSCNTHLRSYSTLRCVRNY